MAATTWIIGVSNQLNIPITLHDGENTGKTINVAANGVSHDYSVAIPWVDRQDEMWKALRVAIADKTQFWLFQHYSKDRIVMCTDGMFANKKDVTGDPEQGRNKILTITPSGHYLANA
jgi:hypothetical protein